MSEEREYQPTLVERIAEAIPGHLTATPHVGIGGARRAKIAAAVMPVVQAELAVRDELIGFLRSKVADLERQNTQRALDQAWGAAHTNGIDAEAP